MIPYITYRETDINGRLCYYILQKQFPHYVGLISLGKMDNVISSIPVGGYNLYVNFNGVLQGNFIPSYNDVLDEIDVVLSSMADWFYYNRVVIEPKKYSRFKIN